MTTSKRKAESIRQTPTHPNDTNSEPLNQSFKPLGTEYSPGQETVEEMREGVRRATRDFEDGMKGYISHEEFMSTFPL